MNKKEPPVYNIKDRRFTMSNVISKDLNIKNFLGNFKIQKTQKNDAMDDLYVNLEKAKKEWEDAKNVFENVSEPDLVDFAIYNIEAAEQKYVYLLKQIKIEKQSEKQCEKVKVNAN